jgi:hypothetical protein
MLERKNHTIQGKKNNKKMKVFDEKEFHIDTGIAHTKPEEPSARE